MPHCDRNGREPIPLHDMARGRDRDRNKRAPEADHNRRAQGLDHSSKGKVRKVHSRDRMEQSR